MCHSGDFYNMEGMTRWERAAENVSNLHPEWRLGALEFECTYSNVRFPIAGGVCTLLTIFSTMRCISMTTGEMKLWKFKEL